MAFGLGSLVMVLALLAPAAIDIEARAILAWAFTSQPVITESKMLCTCDPSCQCGCWMSGRCDCALKRKQTATSTPASYKEAYNSAIRQQKDLAIWVNMRGNQYLPNVIHWSCSSFQGDSTPRLFRAYFYDGKLWDAPKPVVSKPVVPKLWMPATQSHTPNFQYGMPRTPVFQSC